MDVEVLEESLNSVNIKNAILSVIWLVAVLILRFLVVRSIMRRDFPSAENRRRWLVNTRNGLVFVFVAGERDLHERFCSAYVQRASQRRG